MEHREVEIVRFKERKAEMYRLVKVKSFTIVQMIPPDFFVERIVSLPSAFPIAE